MNSLKSNVTPIRSFQQERMGQRVDEIINQLKDQHVKIEDMASRLSRCLATVQLLENSLGAVSGVGSVEEMRSALTDAQAVLKDISQQLNRMGIRMS